METHSILQVNPILPVFDMPRTVAFWHKLGFENIYDSSHYGEAPINYAVLRRDLLCVHLQYFEDIENQFTPQIRFEVKGVEGFLHEYKAAGLVDAHTELRNTPWGTKEFGLFDPNNVGLTFFESL